MTMNKIGQNKIKKLVMAIIFAFVNLIGLQSTTLPTYAVPTTYTEIVNSVDVIDTETTESETTEAAETTTVTTAPINKDQIRKEDLCVEGFDSTAWLLCPKAETGADAVDWLYEKIESVLEINPVSGEAGNVVVKIWDICRGVTNLVFVILLLVVVLSQITGVGISNYGIKRALPKLILAAVLVNLSFYICNLAVDLSNVIGISIRNLFANVEMSVIGEGGTEVYSLSELATSYASYYDGLAGFAVEGPVLGILTFEAGSLFLFIPAVLMGLVAVLSGFITIALRQVVVVLCIMVAPLAIVAMIFPNTVSLFRKWRSALASMLIFFPMFSLLFGASSLAGFAVSYAAGSDSFMALVGMIIQIAPLILCWKMMKMSGTVLNGVYNFTSGTLSKLIVKPAAGYAASLAANRRAHTLAQLNPYTPSAKLAQYINMRNMSRDIDTAEYNELVKLRAMSHNSNKVFKLDRRGRIRGITKDGEETYAMQAKRMEYQGDIMRTKNAMNEGLGQLKRIHYTDSDQKHRLAQLDTANVNMADRMFLEQVHGNDIDYRNALGRDKRFNSAVDARMDQINANTSGHRRHNNVAPTRFQSMSDIMGTDENVQYATAAASSVASSLKQVRQGQFQKYFENTVPTQDVVDRLKALTTSPDATQNMDAIIAGMRTLNQRGDGKLLREAINDLLADKKVEVGTSASQALANFVMTEVKDNDPFLRRFGKYINLETARYYNNDAVESGKARKRRNIDMKEYVEDGYEYVDETGATRWDAPKRGMSKLLMGTSFKGVEREAYLNILEGINENVNDDDARKAIGANALNAIMANIVGDQFNYASGSEQINALAKFITGMKVAGYKDGDMSKPIYEWDEDTLGMFSQDEDTAKNIAYKRTCEFLKAQVPNQIARSKTDMLYAMQQVFVRKAAEDFAHGGNSDDFKKFQAEEAYDKEHNGFKVKTDKSGNEVVSEQERYSHWLFRNALKEATRGGVAKTIARGYQGDTKENLLNALGYNDYADNKLITKETVKYAPNVKIDKNTHFGDVDDDEDGSPYAFGIPPSWTSNPGGKAELILEDSNSSPQDIAYRVYNEYRQNVPGDSATIDALRQLWEGSGIYNNKNELRDQFRDIFGR